MRSSAHSQSSLSALKLTPFSPGAFLTDCAKSASRISHALMRISVSGIWMSPSSGG
jgi:hypothetical protein